MIQPFKEGDVVICVEPREGLRTGKVGALSLNDVTSIATVTRWWKSMTWRLSNG